MTWNILDNLAQDQLVTETHMDEIRGNIEHLGAMTAGGVALSALASGSEIQALSMAQVSHSGNQTIANGATSALAFDSEEHDDNTYHDTVTNNSRLTDQGGGGTYLVFFTLHYDYSGADTGTSNDFDLAILVDGVADITYDQLQDYTNQSSHKAFISGMYVVTLTAGQYVELQITENNGSHTVTVYGGGTRFGWIKVG